MEALQHCTSEKRKIQGPLESGVVPNGLREGDTFLMDIFQEKKKTFKLNRTVYFFKLHNSYDFDFLTAQIKLPVFGGYKGDFQMELVSTENAKMHNEKSRYIFKSLSDMPFKLNGSFVYEAFLERGDVIDLGYNRIHFFKNQEVGNEKDRLPIPEAIIKSSMPILLEGETGTGKTTLAKKIHEESGRSGNFVHLNLSAFSQNLIESELFGHVKGAFTGAVNAKRGAILEAHKGTLFLDEIDSLTIDLQTKLLLFLDNYEVRAVGGESCSSASVRVIFASGSDLKKKVHEEKMRKDFYYRLRSGSYLRLKSLREEKEKIKSYCASFEKSNLVVISPELVDFYMNCSWPGNIRQLKSELLKKKILSNGKRLMVSDEDQELLLEEGESSLTAEVLPMEKMKTKYCYETYLRSNRNITKTAKLLELSHNTLKAYLAKRENDLRDDKVVHVNFNDLPFNSGLV